MTLKIINGIVKNPKQISIPIYFYDSLTKEFTFPGKTGDSLEFPMPKNATFTKPPEVPGKIVIYRKETDDWKLIADKCSKLDNNGFLLETVQNPLPDTPEEPLPKNTEVLVPEGMDKPWFNEELRKWFDKPVPVDFVKPIFNTKIKEWEEQGTPEEIESFIDHQTDELIQSWCQSQGKNEQFYINKAIENGREDVLYQAYVKQKSTILRAQKLKKQTLIKNVK